MLTDAPQSRTWGDNEMYEGFKNEQQARLQMQKEMAQGFKNEENARLLVRNELEVMKERTITETKTRKWKYSLQ